MGRFDSDGLSDDTCSMATTIDYLDRLLDPVIASLTPDAAKKLVRLTADKQTQAHIDELADKCTEGELTPSERAEYEMFVHATDFIAILQAKARARLTRQNGH